MVSVPLSLAMEDRFIVDWEYTLLSLEPAGKHSQTDHLWVWIIEKETSLGQWHLPSIPLAGLRERSESSRNTVLGLCFLTPRTVVGFWRSTLSRSSMILSWWRRSYSCRVKFPRRCWVPSGGGVCAGGGVRDGGGVQGVRGGSSSSTELRLLWDSYIL